MRRRDKSDYLSPTIEYMLNLPNNCWQIRQIRTGMLVIPADLMILAEYALHVTMRKKYIADSLCAGDYRFLTVMCADGRYVESDATPAITQPVGIAFGMAISRAARTILQFIQRCKCFFGNQFTFSPQRTGDWQTHHSLVFPPNHKACQGTEFLFSRWYDRCHVQFG